MSWEKGVLVLGVLALHCSAEPRARAPAPIDPGSQPARPAATASAAAPAASSRIPPDATLKLARTRCFGTCPAYSIVVHPDGSVKYEGEYYVKTCGSAASSVPLATVRELMAELERIGFLELRDSYRFKEDGCAMIVTDHPSYTVELASRTLSKRVERYEGCSGIDLEALDVLAQRIDAALAADRWILPCKEDRDEPPGRLRVYFGLRGTKVNTPDQRKGLNEVIALLKSHPERELEILGQADGNEIPTKQVAQARIDNVVSYLVSQGVDPRRLWTATLGATNLRSATPWAGNRNVELRLKPPLRCGCLP